MSKSFKAFLFLVTAVILVAVAFYLFRVGGWGGSSADSSEKKVNKLKEVEVQTLLQDSVERAIERDENQRQYAKDNPRQYTDIYAIKLECYESPNYVVINEDSQMWETRMILVKDKERYPEGVPCVYKEEGGDLKLEVGSLLGLKGGYLIASPEMRMGEGELVVYDLEKREVVSTDKARFTDFDLRRDKDGVVSYYVLKSTAPEASDCPQVETNRNDGFDTNLYAEVELELESGNITETGDLRCVQKQ